MKKTLVLLLFSCLTIHAMAQAQVSLGLKAGVNLSKVDGKIEDVSSDNITSFNGGAFALIKLSKIGIQPEILFSKQGGKFDDADLDLTYVNVPVMVKLYLAAGVNLQAGPQFGFLTKAKLEDQDVKEFLKGTDMSASFGLGWDAPFGLIFDARYNLGLTEINDFDGDAIKNRVIQISIGYKFIKFGK